VGFVRFMSEAGIASGLLGGAANQARGRGLGTLVGFYSRFRVDARGFELERHR
jgi:hypothetical protein